MKILKSTCLLLLTLTLTFITGCRRGDGGCPPDEYYIDIIDSKYKSIVPYNGLDTLKFIQTDLGDTQIFIGTGKDTGFTDQDFKLNYECPNGHAQLEYVSFKFVNSTIPAIIELELYKKGHNDLTYISVEFNRLRFTPSVNALLSVPYSYDTIKVQGRNYYDVQKIYLDGSIGPSPYYMLYNRYDGIVRLKLTDNVNMELMK